MRLREPLLQVQQRRVERQHVPVGRACGRDGLGDRCLRRNSHEQKPCSPHGQNRNPSEMQWPPTDITNPVPSPTPSSPGTSLSWGAARPRCPARWCSWVPCEVLNLRDLQIIQTTTPYRRNFCWRVPSCPRVPWCARAPSRPCARSPARGAWCWVWSWREMVAT